MASEEGPAEFCMCGHPNTSHGFMTVQGWVIDDSKRMGACNEEGCDCEKFRSTLSAG
jgi:hypothetical protein